MSSSLEVNQFKTQAEKHCIHTKHIYSLIDAPKKEDIYKKWHKHVESCQVCSLEFKNFQAKILASQVFIPRALMDIDLRQSFERELDELFKVMNLNKRENLKNNVARGFKFVDQMGIDFIKNLKSKQMMKAYAIALLIIVCLKLAL